MVLTRSPATLKAAAKIEVATFVHQRVPSISYDATTPHALSQLLRRFDHRFGAPHIVRYTMPCAVFARWTAEQLAKLDAASGMREPRTYQYACAPAAGKC